MWKLEVENGIESVFAKWNFQPQLLMGAGPSNCSPRTTNALTMEILSPVALDMYKIMDDIQCMLKHTFQTKNRLTLAIQSSGHGALESILTNLVNPGEKIIVAVGGVWGKRTVAIAQNYGIEVITLSCTPGEIYNFKDLEKQIMKHKPVLLFITHGESSAGTCQPLDGLGKICHKYNCLLAVDAVASFGGVPLFIDKWEIDAVAAGSQKAISAPPGMAFLSFSERAEQLMRAKKVPPPFYFDVIALGETWNCFGNPRKYHYTYGSHLLMSVREALMQLIEEGVLETWKRHEVCAKRLWNGLEQIGLELFVEKEENRLFTVASVIVPKDVKWPVLLDYISGKHHIDISFGLGPTAHTCIRVGSMGYNATYEKVDTVLKALEDGLKYCRSENGQNGPNSRSEVME
ncbi:serine--pyruvate aminotransferase-like [Agrilus planipennis]|uniref:Alanine--glyoxylate aminotransferase n=1 Tax=Agrilus planipennis TaxID=224129 RepID=A0A1W4X347_AGRPL|nr:serine--pyruvate aminotransferase-like [Agrilus planipennis]